MYRLAAVALVFYLSVTNQLPLPSGLLGPDVGQPTTIAAIIIGLLLIPTLRNHLE